MDTKVVFVQQIKKELFVFSDADSISELIFFCLADLMLTTINEVLKRTEIWSSCIYFVPLSSEEKVPCQKRKREGVNISDDHNSDGPEGQTRPVIPNQISTREQKNTTFSHRIYTPPSSPTFDHS